MDYISGSGISLPLHFIFEFQQHQQDMTYSEIINSDTPTLVDFTATWCGPCRAMAPVLEQLAGKIGESARIIKIDVDKNPAIAEKLNIQGVPTFILYKKGQIIWRQSGMQSLNQLETLIKQAQDS